MTNKFWVEKVNVPQNRQDMSSLGEWKADCIRNFGDNRWRKMLNDHIFAKEHKAVIGSILVTLKEMNRRLTQIEEQYKKNGNKKLK